MKDEKRSVFTVREMVFTAICAALICILAPRSVPVGAIPISLGTFAIYFSAALLGGKRGTVAVIVYIMLGMVGLPVFTAMRGGVAVLFGATGGYIIGYIPLALLTGVFSDMKSKLHWTMPLGMVLGTVALYTFGTAWYMIMSGSTLAAALLACVVPFLAFDAVKMVLATLLAVVLRARLSRYLDNK